MSKPLANLAASVGMKAACEALGVPRTTVHPEDPDAEITKMKDGSTHLAHKLETAVDMKTGAVHGVTLHCGAQGDTKTIDETL